MVALVSLAVYSWHLKAFGTRVWVCWCHRQSARVCQPVVQSIHFRFRNMFPGSPPLSSLQEVLLVLDGTTGLNMLPQARQFNEVSGRHEGRHCDVRRTAAPRTMSTPSFCSSLTKYDCYLM